MAPEAPKRSSLTLAPSRSRERQWHLSVGADKRIRCGDVR